ncbi:MAG: hypothetical protein WCW31_02220 [Patescibacteria group bacterium]|jgi:hypothetical protein
MNSGNVYEKLYKAWASISAMTIGDSEHRQRDPESVLFYIQRIINEKDFMSVFSVPDDSVSLVPVEGWATDYTRFYKEVFNLTVDFTNVKIPWDHPGFDWVVMIAQGLTMNQTWAKCTRYIHSYTPPSQNLDSTVTVNDRTSATAYAIRVRGREESDEENAGFSADVLANRKVCGLMNLKQNITLLEYLVLCLWYNWKTRGKLLDTGTVTLCAGSRHEDGTVPCVDNDKGSLGVWFCQPAASGSLVASRTVLARL